MTHQLVDKKEKKVHSEGFEIKTSMCFTSFILKMLLLLLHSARTHLNPRGSLTVAHGHHQCLLTSTLWNVTDYVTWMDKYMIIV